MKPDLPTVCLFGVIAVCFSLVMCEGARSEETPDTPIAKAESGGCITDQDVYKNVLGFNAGSQLAADLRGGDLSLFRVFYENVYKTKMIENVDRLMVFENPQNTTVWVWAMHEGCVVTDDFLHVEVWKESVIMQAGRGA